MCGEGHLTLYYLINAGVAVSRDCRLGVSIKAKHCIVVEQAVGRVM